MVNPPTEQQLWQFSLALYPKIQQWCLDWQDSFGVNINLLLLLCYLEQQRISLTAKQLQQLSAKLEHFNRQFTQPLRALRRNSNHTSLSAAAQQQLKQTLLAAELSLEQLEQQLLIEHCPTLTPQAQPLIELYLAQLQASNLAIASQILDLRQTWQQLG
ncbi:hypothetical protein VT06_11605 [Arsukibacterium sp. MJ3]|uniref:TIGR02444 family protein n=1 Tax=Arsukibacterium sp. MJ3 TaxID=1632859 RepID=UPI000627139B|nr:TIGR02444 family protein [Arsukibacterium sp. MJ3]KKO48542.1 hypothetical protein VT06_11605 [Arsukibacterium sp. MJ3]